jgi:hypothetical protein
MVGQPFAPQSGDLRELCTCDVADCCTPSSMASGVAGSHSRCTPSNTAGSPCAAPSCCARRRPSAIAGQHQRWRRWLHAGKQMIQPECAAVHEPHAHAMRGIVDCTLGHGARCSHRDEGHQCPSRRRPTGCQRRQYLQRLP